jgi:hypothetical protein
LLGIVSDDRDGLPPDGLSWSLLHDLMAQIRCDEITLAGLRHCPAGGLGRADYPA